MAKRNAERSEAGSRPNTNHIFLSLGKTHNRCAVSMCLTSSISYTRCRIFEKHSRGLTGAHTATGSSSMAPSYMAVAMIRAAPQRAPKPSNNESPSGSASRRTDARQLVAQAECMLTSRPTMPNSPVFTRSALDYRESQGDEEFMVELGESFDGLPHSTA